MKGWKTWMAAAGAFCTGVAMVADGLLSDPLDPNRIYQGLLACGGALGLIGIGHKVEKAKS